MANKTEKRRRYEEARRKQQQRELRALRPFDIAALAAAAVLLLCFFFDWAQVYNSSAGVEVRVSGFSFAIAALTGSFNSAAAVYGNLAVPFYYYAQSYSIALGVLSLAGALAAVASVALPIVRLATGTRRLLWVDIALAAVAAGLLIACFAVGLAMNGSNILSIYCSGNPACSIQSYAMIAAIVAVGLLVLQICAALRARSIKQRCA